MNENPGQSQNTPVFGEPTPLGLIGLAIGCAALTPIAFGCSLTPAGFKTAAVWALLFGTGCQMLAGLMSLTNKNVLGGTLFTAFSFMWAINAWTLNSIANGFIPDAGILLAIDITLLLIFAVLTYGFGFFSSLLFAFLLDIDLLFLAKVVKHFAGPAPAAALSFLIGCLTVLMGLIALWLAFAMLINPIAGRVIFPAGRPLFQKK
ncbi:MAG: hypothetical protein NTX59_04260 [Elusimicrobia bacterium]|nr:hypothetical protein [Elusimicrobiota bacterium]